jgi:lipoprotein signal peptidase
MKRTLGVVIGVDLLAKTAAVAFGISLRNNAYALGVVGGTGWMLTFISGAALVVATRRLRPRVDEIALALIVGGAASNLLDRAVTGAVHDFIPAGPIVFNVADVALVAGVALAIVKRRVSAASDPASGMATTPLQ